MGNEGGKKNNQATAFHFWCFRWPWEFFQNSARNFFLHQGLSMLCRAWVDPCDQKTEFASV